MSNIKRFIADRRGGVALSFGIALIPILGLAGAAIDYSRFATERARLQAAMDATALAVIHLPPSTPNNEVQTKAQSFFQSIYKTPPGIRMPVVSANYVGTTLTMSTSETMPTTLLSLIGTNSLTIGARTTTVNQQPSVEIALALDNTGSMAQNGKLQSLKTAVNNMLTSLQSFSRRPGDVKVSIVPFNTQVNIGTATPNASYLRYDVAVTNPDLSSYLSARGISRSAPTPSNWNGCLSDRDRSYFDYDTRSDPATGIANTRYVASFCHYYSTSNGRASPGLQVAPMKSLTSDLESIRATNNAMVATGATNITMGVVMGMSTLRNDSPFGADSSSDPLVRKFLVVLTDGLNTQNRFVGTGFDNTPNRSQIDARLTLACNAAKATATRVFTIGVQDGQSALLRDCASNSSSYYGVDNASQLDNIFRQILNEITGIRVGS